MNAGKRLLAEFQMEAANTKKYLDRLPEDKLMWRPHEKSMLLGRLAMHIAELPIWIIKCFETEEIDFEKGGFPPRVTPENKKQVIETFDEMLAKVYPILANASDETLGENWMVRRGDIIIYTMPRAANVRWVSNHIIHHRGQLSVYLRLLDVPLPGLYGPSADERPAPVS
jgi:uncharacterized damage-inducible protein DinB